MNYNIVEHLRKESVESLFTMRTFSGVWGNWQKEIRNFLGPIPTNTSIIDLGDHLLEIFTSTSKGGRSQSSLSGGGAAWEALVTWYINLCTAGTRIVAVKKMSMVPKPIQHAITVNYGNSSCNTESDITVIVFPDIKEYKTNLNEVSVKDENGVLIDVFKKTKFNYSLLSETLAKRDFGDYEIGVVQCKTNWNDNAQIPMLWDMIYSANGFKDHKITIGKEGFSIKGLNNFSYSFVTVPSNKRAKYKSDSVAVKRVTNLTGGNYWGKPTSQHIAKSVKEIFNNNFQNGFNKSLREDIKKSISHLKGQFDYFRL